jgi:cellobiose phosphorylase
MTSTTMELTSPAGLRAAFDDRGTLLGLTFGEIAVNLFVGSPLEGGPANLVLRLHGEAVESTLLLGPRSPTRWHRTPAAGRLEGAGEWNGLRYRIAFRLAATAPAWFWHVQVENAGARPVRVDLIHLQDLALAPYAAVRMNEYYVSQYIDHTPLEHPRHGTVLASRQNQPVGGRHPWCVIGSLQRAVAYATDALQVHGLSRRADRPAPAFSAGLPATRLQHEHAMAALQDAVCELAPGATVTLGAFGCLLADHPAATAPGDLAVVDRALALPEARPPAWSAEPSGTPGTANLFTSAPVLDVQDLDAADLDALFAGERRHVERDAESRVLGFFRGTDRHVVLRAKELAVLRPHGHLLRTGLHRVPDESALTSTAWMGGVFHSMTTQGHVSINRCLSTLRSYLGLYRAQGLRVFVEVDGGWRLLDQPSAFEMAPDACRWIYRHARGAIEVRSDARSAPHALGLAIDVVDGPALRCLVVLHVALNGDDGSVPGRVAAERDGRAVAFAPRADSELGRRFPHGQWRIEPTDDATTIEQIGGDELLFADGGTRDLPYLVLRTTASSAHRFAIVGRFVTDGPDVPADSRAVARTHGEVSGPAGAQQTASMADRLAAPPDGSVDASEPIAAGTLQVTAPAASPAASGLLRLVELLPWLRQNALIHYLAPRGLEQFSGGGWGTRDVCQGPVELLLAHGDTASMRDLLLRVMKAQRSDGDWPQWFMFFERDASIRAGDSHGDIVFWPLLALGQYLIASGDAAILDEPVAFYPSRGRKPGKRVAVWQHVLRALALTRRRTIAGTALAAYGHGDWNDALQPADPAMREHMCSAWTVTLHHQTLTTLARALRRVGRRPAALRLERQAEAVRRDFARLLLVDDVLAGYALFEPKGAGSDTGAADRASAPAADGADRAAAPPAQAANLASATAADPSDAGSAATPHIRYLLHPRDETTGVRYSVLAMIHAILEGLFDRTQLQQHLHLIDEHLTGPDGVRLFDRPLDYHGGPQRHFQRAESAAYFGREIGLMYMHAHLRFAQALAHVGDAEGFLRALCQANPIGLREIVPSATLRQSNCYYSSSDAAFADRYQASAEYERVRAGTIALDGGWRVYSSGAGILFSLVVRHLFGLRLEADALLVDPVLPPALDGLRIEIGLLGQRFEIGYRVRGAGCGVDALQLDGLPLTFDEEPNPYRRGAARVALGDLAAAADATRPRRLDIVVGTAGEPKASETAR